MSESLIDLYLRPDFVSQLNIHPVADPELKWIDDECYRVLSKPDIFRDETEEEEEIIVKPMMKPYDDNEDTWNPDYNDYDIEITESGRYRTEIRMPHKFYAYIIGAKGSRRKQIENDTRTDIMIPKNPDHNKIVIKGPTERSVALARRRIEMMGLDLRNRHPITHFISYPLISDEIMSNFLKFKDLVVNGGHIDGVDETIFLNPNKLHLTIGVMVLLDKDEKDDAAEILEYCRQDIISTELNPKEPLVINVKGLQYMNDDPSQVDVLYATVSVLNHENPNILQQISDAIASYFYEKGLMKKESDHIKLHATLMNSRYRKDLENGAKSQPNNRISFDARPILEKYHDFDFGTQEFTSVHLSHRFSEDKNGYYESVFTISCT